MSIHGYKKPLEQMIAAIDALDLDPIKVKLMDPEEGEGWSRDFVDQMEIEYKRYLKLEAKYPTTIVPTKGIDKFWHQHILDTQKYAEDCEKIFGEFLHHYPYFGMNGEEDAANLQKAFDETAELYLAEFGESAARHAQDVQAAFCCYCSTKCGGGNPYHCSTSISVRPTLPPKTTAAQALC